MSRFLDKLQSQLKFFSFRDRKTAVIFTMCLATLFFLFVGCSDDSNNQHGSQQDNIVTSLPVPTITSTSITTNTLIPSPTHTATPEFQGGDRLIITLPRGDVTSEMVYIPAGTFMMGSNEVEIEEAQTLCQAALGENSCAEEWNTDETPVHERVLEAFWIDRTEVSNRMYAQCIAAGFCKPLAITNSFTDKTYYESENFAEYPVIIIDWAAAMTFCEWRNARLPTEAEWEKAARGDDSRLFPWGDTFNGRIANYCDSNCPEQLADAAYNDGFPEIAPVHSYEEAASPYGVLNMAGNVWEWTADWYLAYPGNPGDNGFYGETYRVVRGGSWINNRSNLRAANRDGMLPFDSSFSVGFRCVQAADGSPTNMPPTKTPEPIAESTAAPLVSEKVLADPSIGCSIADRFAAIAPVGGTLALGFNCAPEASDSISIMNIHGRNDLYVDVTGTTSSDGYLYTAVADVLSLWANADSQSCDAEVTAYETAVDGIQGMSCTQHANCQSGAEVVSCWWDGDHDWPNDVNMSGNQMIWDFFRSNSK